MKGLTVHFCQTQQHIYIHVLRKTYLFKNYAIKKIEMDVKNLYTFIL